MTEPFSTEKEKSRTRGSLVPARLYAADKDGKDKNELTIHCSFNPFEYTVSQTNSYNYKPKAGAETKVEFKSAGPQSLKLSLIFDAYENDRTKDVSQTTRKLWKLMTPDYVTEVKKPDAPFVIFEWGVFKFLAVITNMTQKFILFDHGGVPLRAKVDITFTQHKSQTDDYKKDFQATDVPNNKNKPIKAGDRIDSIAANESGNPANWRDIAKANNITNPLALRPGQNMLIPGGKNG